MNRIPDLPPPVDQVPATEQRPLWSVRIPVFNCASFLAETLTSVLEQYEGPAHMEIVVVDDASTDANVAGLVTSIGRGRVGYIRQSENVGSLRNFDTCLSQSRGYFIHLLHGDDKVYKGYYPAMTSCLSSTLKRVRLIADTLMLTNREA